MVETAKTVSNKRVKVLVQGFLTDVDVPSEERLSARMDLSGLSDLEHMTWVRGLQDLLSSIDVNYKIAATGRGDVEPTLRKRSVKVRYVKDESGRLVKVATFHPYPSVLVNRLKTIRHKVYDVLNENCLILQEERVGRMKRKLYFLPSSLAPELMNAVEGLNTQLQSLKQDVAEFEGSGHFIDIAAHVKKAGFVFNGFHANLTPISISPIPLSLSKDFFMQYLETEKQKALGELDEKRKAGLVALEYEIERKRQEMIAALNQDLQNRFSTVLAMAEEAVKAAVKGRSSSQRAASRRLQGLSQLVQSVGLEFDERPISALANTLAAAGEKDVGALKSAVRELAESLGVQPTGDPVRDVELASRAARGKSVLLFTVD